MLNFTLTITAAPELLAAMTSFTSAITAAKVALIPEYKSDFTDHKISKEQTAASYNQPVPQALYQEQNTSIQQGMGAQQKMQAQAPAAVTPMYNQPNTVSLNQINNPGDSVSVYGVQASQKAAAQIQQAAGVNGYVYSAQGQQQAASQAPQVQNGVPVQTAPSQVSSVPTSAQSYTMEQLAVAATQIVDAGHRAELVRLLSSFGVQALTALPKEQYGAFATSLRALGAKI